MGALNSTLFDVKSTPLGWVVSTRPSTNGQIASAPAPASPAAAGGNATGKGPTGVSIRRSSSVSSTSGSRHPSHSPCYDHAHEGQWKLLVPRTTSHPTECSYVDRFHNTPLHLACRRQPPLDVVEAMVRANPGGPRVTTVDGLTPLHFACYCGASAEVVSALVDHYPEATALRDKRGRTPMHFASAGFRAPGRSDILRKLCDANSAVVNWEDERGRTPLTLLFEDYAEEIEDGDVEQVMTEVMRKRRKELEPSSRDGEGDDPDAPRERNSDGEIGDMKALHSSFSGVEFDPEEIEECWESLVLLIQAAYHHLRQDGAAAAIESVLSDDTAMTDFGGGGGDARPGDTRPGSDHSTGSSSHQSFHSANDPSGLVSGVGNNNESHHSAGYVADQRNWNVVHAAVGVPRTPSKFVQAVLAIHPELVAERDVNGSLPLHVAASAPTVMQYREQQRRRDECVRRNGTSQIANGHDGGGGQRLQQQQRNRRSHSSPHTTPSSMPGLEEFRKSYPASLKGSGLVRVMSLSHDMDESDAGSHAVVIRSLVTAYPAGAMTRDGQGKLPLNLAIEQGKSWGEGGVSELVRATIGGCGAEGLKREEADLQRSILAALGRYTPPAADEPSTGSGSGSGTIPEEAPPGREERQVECSDVQKETSRTLAKLLPYFSDKTTFAEELLSRSLVVSTIHCSPQDATNAAADPADERSGDVGRARDIATRAAMLHALGTVLRSYGDGDDEGGEGGGESITACSLDVGRRMLFHPEAQCIRSGAAMVLGAACDRLGLDATMDVLRNVILSPPAVEGDVGSPLKNGRTSSTHGDDSASVATSSSRGSRGGKSKGGGGVASIAVDHGRACAIYSIFSSPVGCRIVQEGDVCQDITSLVKALMCNRGRKGTPSTMVREAACMACGSILGSARGSSQGPLLKEFKGAILKSMRPTEGADVHVALAKGLCVAVVANPDVFRGHRAGVAIEEGALMLAMTAGTSKVKRAYNEFLWLALKVGDGEEGLNDYMKRSQGENGKIMMTLVTKVLVHMEPVVAVEDF